MLSSVIYFYTQDLLEGMVSKSLLCHVKVKELVLKVLIHILKLTEFTQ